MTSTNENIFELNFIEKEDLSGFTRNGNSQSKAEASMSFHVWGGLGRVGFG